MLNPTDDELGVIRRLNKYQSRTQMYLGISIPQLRSMVMHGIIEKCSSSHHGVHQRYCLTKQASKYKDTMDLIHGGSDD